MTPVPPTMPTPNCILVLTTPDPVADTTNETLQFGEFVAGDFSTLGGHPDIRY